MLTWIALGLFLTALILFLKLRHRYRGGLPAGEVVTADNMPQECPVLISHRYGLKGKLDALVRTPGGALISTSLERAEALGKVVSSVTLHVPKHMSREEMDAVYGAVRRHSKQNILQIVVVKISEEETFFAVDTRFKDGIPHRGTVLQLNDRDYLLYTEGRDEKESWANFRVPVALRITPQNGARHPGGIKTVIRQINDLSQVNWRGFNARSKPISNYYGTLIAALLSHIPAERMKDLPESSRRLLEERMWFI